jgi:hypothetical protein
VFRVLVVAGAFVVRHVLQSHRLLGKTYRNCTRGQHPQCHARAATRYIPVIPGGE